MNGVARFSIVLAALSFALVARPERARAGDFWAEVAESDHGASRRAVRAATRMLEGRGDDSDAHRVRLALIEGARGPGLSDRALVAVSRIALELGVSPSVERLERLERIAWSTEIAPWSAAAARVLGAAAWQRGASAEASRYWLRALELSFEPGERAELFVRLGFAQRRLGEVSGAGRFFSRSLALAEDASVARRDVETALLGLAVLALEAGDGEAAQRLAKRSQAVESTRSNVSGVSLVEVFALAPEEAAALEGVRALSAAE